EALKGAALAGYGVEVRADILNCGNSGSEQRAMRRIPFWEIGDGFAPRRFLVLWEQIFDLRAIAMRSERCGERMIDARGVDADELHLLSDQPLGRGFAQARRIAKILLAVGIFAMPAGVYNHDVVREDGRCRLFQ